MKQPKPGQKFRIKSLPGRVFKCIYDGDVTDCNVEECWFYHYGHICVKMRCATYKCHYIEVTNAKTEK